MAKKLPSLEETSGAPRSGLLNKLAGVAGRQGASALTRPDLSDPVPSRATKYLESNQIAYMIHLSQAGQGLGSVTMLVHSRKFTQPEIDQMVAEAARITDEASVGSRRKAMAAARTPVTPDLNEKMFPFDVEFFEGVMLDKFQFKRLSTINSRAQIQPTARL